MSNRLYALESEPIAHIGIRLSVDQFHNYTQEVDRRHNLDAVIDGKLVHTLARLDDDSLLAEELMEFKYQRGEDKPVRDWPHTLTLPRSVNDRLQGLSYALAMEKSELIADLLELYEFLKASSGHLRELS